MNGVFVVNVNGALCGNARASMVAAAERWGCEFFEVNEGNDPKWPMHPAAYKCGVFELTGWDGALVLDADTVVSARCPSPFEEFPAGRLVVVANGSPRLGDFSQVRGGERYEWERMREAMEAEGRGQSSEGREWPCYVAGSYFNSGVMRASRRENGDMFFEALRLCKVDRQLGWIDQTPLNWAAARRGIEKCWADESWNYLHPDTLGQGWMEMGRTGKFIYHFAGMCGRERILPVVKWNQ